MQAINNFILLFKPILNIHYSIKLKKNQAKVYTLLDFTIKVTVIILIYAAKLGVKVKSIDIKAQKINVFFLTYLK